MAPPPPAPARFPFWTEEKLRLADTDLNGHVNNNAIGALCEAGRVEVIQAATGPLGKGPVTMVLARLEIDYLREVHYPGRVRIGTAVTRIGRSSVGLQQALYLDGACFATSAAVLVAIDRQSRQPMALTPALRAGFEALAPAGEIAA